MRVLVACEFSGRVRDAFRRKGHDAWSCDLLPTESKCGGDTFYSDDRYHVIGDAIHLLEDMRLDILIAFPPCTHLCSSGARWFGQKRKDGRQQSAIDFFMKLVDTPVKKKCIENPVGIMSTVYRKPDQIVQPWQFGHGETKATCFWLFGLPLLESTRVVDGRMNRIHRMPPSPDRAKKRSITYQGIAKAMAEQWG